MTQGFDYWSQRPLADPKMDWAYDSGDWVQGYVDSVDHPHRQVFVDEIGKIKPENVLELGSNTGPNLVLLKQKFPELKIAGIDANPDAIRFAKHIWPEADWRVGDILQPLPYEDKSFDVILCDAVLMYVAPSEIESVMKEINRVAKKAVLIIDWFDDSKDGVEKDWHWARSYHRWLRDLGFGLVWHRKLEEHEWPVTKKWQNNGHIFVGRR